MIYCFLHLVKIIVVGYFISFLAAVSFLLNGCSNSNDSNRAGNAADTLEKTNEYAGYLEDLSGSRDMAEILCQGWVLEEDMEVLSSSNEPEGMMPFRSFYLSPDSTFIKDIRNFPEYGTWKFDNAAKKIILTHSDGSRDEYKIAKLAVDELVVINTGVGSITQLKYVSDGKTYYQHPNDPFHMSNNRWRIKPKKAETGEQIKQRLKDYLHFHILFYRDNLARRAKTISFYGFPTCLKWYAGGIYIIKKEELAENWYKCFYNKEQAMKAYMMMDDLIGKKYKWPEEKNISWVKKNLAVLEQMYEKL
jgi:hypothetical protein